ncbi:polysaccharide deacetylase family protein, partial [Leptospira selangorensis]
MSLDPTNEEKEIQDIVHELSKDIEKDRVFAKKLRRFAFISALSFVGLTVFVLLSYLLYLSLSVTKLESEVKEKERNLRELEQSLFSLMYQEQLREENALAGDAEPDTELAKQVEENIQFLKEVSQNAKGRNILRGNESHKEIALTFDLATG